MIVISVLFLLIILEIGYLYQSSLKTKKSSFQPNQVIENPQNQKKSNLEKTTSITSGLEAKTQVKSDNSGCPEGFVRIPGSSTYQTKDFCIMKYEAKCDVNGDGTGDVSGLNTSYDGWDNSNDPCFGKDRKIVSSAKGWPVTRISQADAKNYCKNMGWHLSTNAEWMTIARNIEKNSSNWCANNTGNDCGGNLENKMLTIGHSNDVFIDAAIQASENDNEACYSTTAKEINLACGKPNTEKRTHLLSNGAVIWDFSGNVWEWIDQTVKETDLPTAWNGKVIRGGGAWSDFNKKDDSDWYLKDMGIFQYNDLGPADRTLNSTNGTGRIYHNSNPGETAAGIFAVDRGGGWANYSNSGIYAVAMNRETVYTNVDVGFRCVVEIP